MKTILKAGLGVALLALVAGCGNEAPSGDNQAVANEQNIIDSTLIVDPEIPNAAVETNVGAAVEPAGTNDSAAVKIAPVPPAPPKAPPKAKADAPKPKAPPPATDPHAGHDMNEM